MWRQQTSWTILVLKRLGQKDPASQRHFIAFARLSEKCGKGRGGVPTGVSSPGNPVYCDRSSLRVSGVDSLKPASAMPLLLPDGNK